MTTSTKSPPHAPLAFLGLACAVGVSTMYYNQPLLLEMGTTYGAAPGRTGFVAVATQVGYALLLAVLARLIAPPSGASKRWSRRRASTSPCATRAVARRTPRAGSCTSA